VSQIEETEISRAILQAHCDKLAKQLTSDVVVVGAGPSGLAAAAHLARNGKRVTVIEKRLAPGGGIWGGAMGMNDVVVQEEAIPILDEAGVRHQRRSSGLYVADAMELASALCLDAIRSGAVLLNLLALEDLCIHQQRVTGVVVNRTTLLGTLPVDPIVLTSGAVIDASGHEAVAVERLRSRRLLPLPGAERGPGEGPMDAAAGEAFVVDRTGQVYPGLWVTGMSVCATFGGPRMGPIFGGMLLSGRKVAGMILAQLSPEQLRK
jgi:thiamine thiazole synthase